jgi:hypothetical protein
MAFIIYTFKISQLVTPFGRRSCNWWPNFPITFHQPSDVLRQHYATVSSAF